MSSPATDPDMFPMFRDGFSDDSKPVIPWGPTGETVYTRTYSRPKPDGSPETWPETVERVAAGNLALVYGKDRTKWSPVVWQEFDDLVEAMTAFKIIPAGRHLWATGVANREYLFNCHVSGWGERASDHFEFTFMRLMEGGGVGANYSSVYTEQYGAVLFAPDVHIVCDEAHPDYAAMKAAGVLSETYSAEWGGAFPVEDSREGWAAALVDLIDTAYDGAQHEQRVYDVSRVRAKGQPLRTFGGTASGPQPLAELLLTTGKVMTEIANDGQGSRMNPLQAMTIDHAIGKCVVAGGVRRSARMSILPWNDPWIMEFIGCKAESGDHWTTNISVAIDDEFIRALHRFNGWERHSALSIEARARRVHEAVVKGMLTNGEPGYWNVTKSNEGEPNPVIATNPCGEIALEAWENCNLGHVNMDAHYEPREPGQLGPERFDYQAAVKSHRLMTRFLIRATYGDVTDGKQAAKLARNRRIGVGHFGVQGWFVKTGTRFSDAAYESTYRRTLRALYKDVRHAATEYAHDLRIPVPVKLTTVAPTGSIAKMPGRSEGIHPIYAKYFNRRIRFSELRESEMAQVEDYRAKGYHVEPCIYADNTLVVTIPTVDSLVGEVNALGLNADELVESADEIDLIDMLAVQAMYQECWADNAVSFTANVPEGKYDLEHAAGIIESYLPDLKGTTIMPDGTRPQAPYERLTRSEFSAASALVGIVTDSSVDEDCSNGACPIR